MKHNFRTLSEFETVLGSQPEFDQISYERALKRNSELTKPEGSLGRLEEIALWIAGWQGRHTPRLDRIQIAIFAGNHGIATKGVSAYPKEVTAQMVSNFENGGAAINQLAKLYGAHLDVYALDLEGQTQDFTVGVALTEVECIEAILSGWDSVSDESDLFIAGEMGIGNTTSASALAAAICGGEVEKWVGRGTGVDEVGLKLKAEVINKGLQLHLTDMPSPLKVLCRLGGREIAAIAGAIASARFKGVPFLLDGFICTAAALVLEKTFLGSLDHVIAGHVSAESGHVLLLQELNKEPLLSLGMRLGEGSGAAVAIGILKAAIECHNGMATFNSAGVSNKS